MKKTFYILVLIFITALQVSAHPGNLDKYQGHTCYENCSTYGLYDGEYHYHYKTSTLLHCPDDFDEKEYFEIKKELETLDVQKRDIENEVKKKYPTLSSVEQLNISYKRTKDIYDEIFPLQNKLSILTKYYYGCQQEKREEEREKI